MSQKKTTLKVQPLDSLLPDFPWDALRPYKEQAANHEGGMVDLSVGTPVDTVPVAIQKTLAEAADAHGYPLTVGTGELQQAIIDFLQRRRGAENLHITNVLPTIGSKELVALLPTQLGVNAQQAVAFPHIAYPTYDIGARLVGAKPLPLDMVKLAEGDLVGAGLKDSAAVEELALLWLNSPGNPSGEVLSVEQMRSIVQWARANGIVVASDECYALLPWEVEDIPSILDPRVNDGDLDGLLCVYSLSKQSNLAGYRTAFVAGDEHLIHALKEIRRHSGFMVPGPVQAAMVTALNDDETARKQRSVYRARRVILKSAVEAFGGTVEGSQAGLYLWTTFGEDCFKSVQRLADLGIICAPGSFYGEAGQKHVRIALTATDERIRAAASRLRAAVK